MKVLITCPPMVAAKESFVSYMEAFGIEVYCADVVQTLTEKELIDLVHEFDGWIVGDDPVTYDVLMAGRNGRLKALIKWGVGTDNVNFEACEKVGILVDNTPNMFGKEVADIALGYVIALARQTFLIDRGVREGCWPKYRGISLADKTVALVGLGDIGKNTLKRLKAADMKVIGYDPNVVPDEQLGCEVAAWPARINEADFIILTCALNDKNRKMINENIFNSCKPGCRLVNVSRGGLIDEGALEAALETGKIHSVALDVFEEEPLQKSHFIRDYPHCILGAHNASNTQDAVIRTNQQAIEKLLTFLEVKF